MKNSSDTIGNRTRDLPAFTAAPQPTAPPAACPLHDVDNLLNDDKATETVRVIQCANSVLIAWQPHNKSKEISWTQIFCNTVDVFYDLIDYR